VNSVDFYLLFSILKIYLFIITTRDSDPQASMGVSCGSDGRAHLSPTTRTLASRPFGTALFVTLLNFFLFNFFFSPVAR
jgi:hypothetical protein